MDVHRRQLRRRMAALTLGAVIGALLGFGLAGRGGETALAGPRARAAANMKPSKASPSRPMTVRIAATGDITFGSTPSLPPDGGRSMFGRVAPVLDADVVVG